jgi:hypothetical protein
MVRDQVGGAAATADRVGRVGASGGRNGRGGRVNPYLGLCRAPRVSAHVKD